MAEGDLGFHPAFWELHDRLPRQGPGSDASTRRAFESLGPLPENPRIVDVGCGPGMQTVELARLAGATVTGVDVYPPFLEQLRRSADGLPVETLEADMAELPFDPASIDLIWSEGAIYILGFETGLNAWRRFLRPGGFLAVTEATWLRSDPPADLAAFWNENYPGMGTVEENVRRAEAAGYRVLDHFPLPAEDWWTHYYTHIEKRIPEVRRKWEGDAGAKAALDAEEEEIALFRRYHEYYGYVFFVMQRKG